MATKELYCTLDFTDIDLSDAANWRTRMIEVVNSEAFEGLVGDLAVTGSAIAATPAARDWGGECHVSAEAHSGGEWRAEVSCGFRF